MKEHICKKIFYEDNEYLITLNLEGNEIGLLRVLKMTDLKADIIWCGRGYNRENIIESVKNIIKYGEPTKEWYQEFEEWNGEINQ